MCTVSWLHEDDGYHLFCSRDEKISRGPALEPRIQDRRGVRFAAPLDRDFGGTWLGVNEFGVTVCLLNGPPGQARRRPLTSRGLLVLEMMDASCQAEVCERIRRVDLLSFAPFMMAVLEPGRDTAVAEWDGDRPAFPADGNAAMPLVSSSFDAAGVRASRREELRRAIHTAGKLDASVLAAFHQSHGAGPSASSVCMHRADARTVSFTRLRVTRAQASMWYTPSPPCEGTTGKELTLWCRRSY